MTPCLNISILVGPVIRQIDFEPFINAVIPPKNNGHVALYIPKSVQCKTYREPGTASPLSYKMQEWFITQTKTPQLIEHFFAQPQLLLALSISRFLWLVIYGTSLLADATTPYLEPLQDSITAQCCPNSSSSVIQRHHEQDQD